MENYQSIFFLFFLLFFFGGIHKSTDYLQYYKIVQTVYSVLQNGTNNYVMLQYDVTSIDTGQNRKHKKLLIFILPNCELTRHCIVILLSN